MTTTTRTTQSVSKLKQSAVWVYFERIDNDKELKAKCLINGCEKVLATPLHSTSTLIRHLRDVHKFLILILMSHRFITRWGQPQCESDFSIGFCPGLGGSGPGNYSHTIL